MFHKIIKQCDADKLHLLKLFVVVLFILSSTQTAFFYYSQQNHKSCFLPCSSTIDKEIGSTCKCECHESQPNPFKDHNGSYTLQSQRQISVDFISTIVSTVIPYFRAVISTPYTTISLHFLRSPVPTEFFLRI